MSEVDPQSGTPVPPKPEILPYEPVEQSELSGDRPGWVYLIFTIYGLLVIILLTAPMWVRGFVGGDLFIQTAVCVACAILSGASLMILPVRVARRRMITRRSIWIPLIGSGFLAGSLAFGAALALYELFKFNSDAILWAIIIASVIVWFGWAGLFTIIFYSVHPESFGMRLHRSLIAGSVMELLIAVPAHIIVRQRNECCAGIMTGMAICIGVVVMFVSFGPSVLLLFYKRRRRITPPRGTAGS